MAGSVGEIDVVDQSLAERKGDAHLRLDKVFRCRDLRIVKAPLLGDSTSQKICLSRARPAHSSNSPDPARYSDCSLRYCS